MGWFDEQIRERKKKEEANFDNAITEIGSILVGKRNGYIDDGKEAAQKSIKASLKQIFNYYHLKFQRELPVSITDLEEQIEYFCRPYGMVHRDVRLNKGWYKDAAGVYLGFKKDGTVAALLPGHISGYYYYDSYTGKKVKLNESSATEFEENAICFYKPFPARKMSVLDLGTYVLESVSKSNILYLIAMVLVTTLMGLLTPMLVHNVFEEVLPTGSMRMLWGIAVFLICITISIWMAENTKKLVSDKIGAEIEIFVQAAAMSRVLSLPASFFKQYSSGEITTKIKNLNSLCNMIYTRFITAGLTCLFSLVYILQIVKYTPVLAGPSFAIILLTWIIMIVNTYFRMKIKKKAMEDEEKKNGFTYMLLLGIQKIKLAGAEKRAFTKWVKYYTKEVKNTYGIPSVLLLGGTIGVAVTLAGTLVMYYLAVKSGVTVADYYAFSSAYGMLTGAFSMMSGIGVQLAKIQPTIESIRPILDAVPEASEDKAVVTSLTGDVELNHVSFRYSEKTPWVLNDISLKILSGQYVGIVGKSGCGKSTMLRLLLGFETPVKGAVLYDDKNIETLDLKSLRKRIGVVMQNSKLFHGDVFSNISIAAPWLTLDEAWEAAEMAEIAEDIREMPMKMSTMITEGSGCISGGQKQRLMIARALASKPNVLMFDEATSALDNVTQKKIENTLNTLNCTRIVIAHRLSTVKNCDCIYVLDEGKIVEEGNYETLIEQKGLFYELVQAQMLKDDLQNQSE